ncbi:Methylmalonyl-CoA decarboxylase [Legionella massiliensis]|uniref:Methylmalonyl-CoA decarboxylase n=1 Tax=Legionella massiliensis TaxID=1034943 RepID=A0A078KW57_9GAMM|nr:methylmalonyl-CoA decarboxylase [Legionella massiliensis]CDZ77231.1 Methylmalonyl-CoA decarboxylase [Legionella massiliensis]CEE12969.1 Methylmalonyl-CoA decarboxylase [Legionella massiliensis]
MTLIKTKIEDAIGTIALNHYERRNALSSELIKSLLLALETMTNKKVKVVVLRQAENYPVWSAGHDVTELPLANTDPLPYNDPLEILLRAIRHYKIPTIAMIHGSVWGGAFDLVINCDLIIADESCTFAMTPAKLGLPYNASGIQHFLSRLPINLVKELFFSANPINAERALHYNLINSLIPELQLEKYTYDLAKTIASRSSEAISAFKEQARIINDSCVISPELFEYIEQIRRNVYQGHDYNEGIQAFLEKRPPKFN